MKKLLITLALFFWALIAGEIVNGLFFGEGMLVTLATRDMNSAPAIAAFISMASIFAIMAAITLVITLPSVLLLRRRMPKLLSSICAALAPCLFMLALEFVVAGSLKDSAPTVFILIFVQSFLVAYATAKFWPLRRDNTREVFE